MLEKNMFKQERTLTKQLEISWRLEEEFPGEGPIYTEVRKMASKMMSMSMCVFWGR